MPLNHLSDDSIHTSAQQTTMLVTSSALEPDSLRLSSLPVWYGDHREGKLRVLTFGSSPSAGYDGSPTEEISERICRTKRRYNIWCWTHGSGALPPKFTRLDPTSKTLLLGSIYYGHIGRLGSAVTRVPVAVSHTTTSDDFLLTDIMLGILQ